MTTFADDVRCRVLESTLRVLERPLENLAANKQAAAHARLFILFVDWMVGGTHKSSSGPLEQRALDILNELQAEADG